MVSFDYSSWDLKTLKQAIESSDLVPLDASAQQFDQGSAACAKAADDFIAQVTALGAAWEGAAAQAAVRDARRTHLKMTQMHTASSASSSASKQYYHQAKSDQQRSRSIPNVDDSWGRAITGGAPGGIVGIALAKYQQHQQYQKAHAQATQIAQKMDRDGTAQAQTMRAQSWPDGATSAGNPPSSLPPVPGSGGRSGNIAGNYTAAPRGGGPGGGYTPMAPPTAPNPNDSKAIRPGGGKYTGPGGKNANGTHGESTAPPTIPVTTAPQGSESGTTSMPGGVPTQAIPEPPPGTGGGGGAAAAAAGGAGLLGAGALAARGAAPGARYPGSSEGLADGAGAGRARPRGVAESEGAGARSGAALAEGERGVGLRSGLGAEDTLDSAHNPYLRAGRPDGFLGEPVAGEAGRLGGYPAAGGGARRRDDEQEARIPDYLVETEDVWGDGVTAAPPVIGE